MNTFLIECLLLALSCGLIAAVYRSVLAYEPVLSWWFKWGNKWEDRWFFNPIWGCVKCISGQFGLWFYLVLLLVPGIIEKGAHIQDIGSPVLSYIGNPFAWFFGLILSICGAIFSGILFTIILKRLQNK